MLTRTVGRYRRLVTLFAGLSVVLLASVFVATPVEAVPSATEIRNSWPGYTFGRCLDAEAQGIYNNGDKMQLWDCWGGLNQAWGSGSWDGRHTWYLVNQGGNRKCLDAESHGIYNNGDKVQLWDCWGGLNQQWYIDQESRGTVRFVNKQSLKCLDADTNTIGGNGTRIQLWDCTNAWNQGWYWNDPRPCPCKPAALPAKPPAVPSKQGAQAARP